MDRVRTVLYIDMSRAGSLVRRAIVADGQRIVIPVDGVGPRFIFQRRVSCVEASAHTRQGLRNQIGSCSYHSLALFHLDVGARQLPASQRRRHSDYPRCQRLPCTEIRHCSI